MSRDSRLWLDSKSGRNSGLMLSRDFGLRLDSSLVLSRPLAEKLVL